MFLVFFRECKEEEVKTTFPPIISLNAGVDTAVTVRLSFLSDQNY